MRTILAILLSCSFAFAQKTATLSLIDDGGANSKPRFNNNGVITQFNTEAELKAVVDARSVTDPVLIARYENAIRKKLIGKGIIEDLSQTLELQGLSQADEADLVVRVQSVLVALDNGWIRGARTVCNNLTTSGALTAGRKTFILNQIDAAITNFNL